jgi:hypothetical protein
LTDLAQRGLDLQSVVGGVSQLGHTSTQPPAVRGNSAQPGPPAPAITVPPTGRQQPPAELPGSVSARANKWKVFKKIVRMAGYPVAFIAGSMCLMIGGTILPRGSLASIILVVVGAVCVIPYAAYNGIKTLSEVPAYMRRLRDTAQGGCRHSRHLCVGGCTGGECLLYAKLKSNITAWGWL